MESMMERVLVCALGTSLAVVTETLWWLHDREEPLPDRIVIVTTAVGRAKAEASLTAPGTGGLACFCRDYGLPSIPVSFAVPEAAGSGPYSDIDDSGSATAMADTMTALIRDLTARPGVAVHASIAGGRKTMSYQLGYAMTLFGRAGDRAALTRRAVRAPRRSASARETEHRSVGQPALHGSAVMFADTSPALPVTAP